MIIVGTNSYVTLADFKSYADTQYNIDISGKTDDELEQLLIMATERIDLEKYNGSRASTTQELSFPRTDLPLVDGVDYSDTIPIQVKKATYLLANHLLTTNMNEIGKQNEAIQEVKVGSIGVKFDTDDTSKNTVSYNELPPYVKSYLNDFKVGGGATILVYR